MSNLNDRLDIAEKKIKEPKFRENRGLGNEVGYYIFDYPAEDEQSSDRDEGRNIRIFENLFCCCHDLAPAFLVILARRSLSAAATENTIPIRRISPWIKLWT